MDDIGSVDCVLGYAGALYQICGDNWQRLEKISRCTNERALESSLVCAAIDFRVP